MDTAIEKQHTRKAIAIGFIGSFTVSLISLVFPPDYTHDPPTYPKAAMILGELSYALFIFGCTLMGIKLADDKRVMPSAGFTMLAIAQGLTLVTYFEVGHSTPEEFEKSYEIMTGMLFLILPALWLITRYTEFPRWLNYLGLSACIPMIISTVIFQLHVVSFNVLEPITGIGFMLLGVTSLCWGIRVLRAQ